uniref:PPM-type phosphatase domain-containing protein n=1 Tax=Alexandrium catenella TaxID=2925 RepID=A0A7S1MMI9_ALECA|eukprot:CAMPEP_0171249898 /NCGR_PEP_ID=MMETSP0790-20130122/49803_1 /TAXON_ID=2925 /ORGANISM="Alexandrium catenella, Strain OF101" /LENGTH=398 /DNA_ID=CAMNT_0011717463 /DNA_START=76 /DNA_END=1272 /DNA_ORIENTATION=-
MGCGSTKPETTVGKVQANRRRLSIGNAPDESKDIPANEASEEADRGLVLDLNQKEITDMLNSDNPGNGRKMSIGSSPDQGKTSFANKTIKQGGDHSDSSATTAFLGYTCRKGLKPESPNQDSWFVLKVEKEFSMYAVFDGHGQKGHDVSNFVKENLPKLIIRDPRFKGNVEEVEKKEMLVACFKKTQSLISVMDRTKALSAQMSGTTATVVVHDHTKQKLLVSHVADSSAVLGKCKKGAGGQLQLEATQLTRDHKPNLKDERARIEKNGGRVVFDGYANHRIYAKNARYPGLNMSRCLGDLMGHQDCGITAEPEVSVFAIEADHHVLLVCSDGVWEFISPDDAVKIVADFPPHKAMQAAERLAKEAWDRWIKEEGGAVVDDITVVCVFLNQQEEQDQA